MTDTFLDLTGSAAPHPTAAPHVPAPAGPAPSVRSVQEPSLLQELADDIRQAVELPSVVYEVPHRPHIKLVFDVNISWPQMQAWNRSAVDGRGRPDELLLAKTVVVAKCERIIRRGLPVTFEGRPMTFNSPELWAQTGCTDAISAATRLVGLDPDIGALGEAVLRDAGYGRAVEGQEWRPDPTQA